MIGNGLDLTTGAEINPARPLNTQGSFGKLLLEIFPGLKVLFDQREYSTFWSIGGTRSPKLREELIV